MPYLLEKSRFGINFFAKRNTILLLYVYQVFIFLQDHLHLFLHFFFTFMEQLFFDDPMSDGISQWQFDGIFVSFRSWRWRGVSQCCIRKERSNRQCFSFSFVELHQQDSHCSLVPAADRGSSFSGSHKEYVTTFVTLFCFVLSCYVLFYFVLMEKIPKIQIGSHIVVA